MRVFNCHDCGHKMRLTGESCGYCYTRKAWYQQSGVFCSAVALSCVVIGVILASIL